MAPSSGVLLAILLPLCIFVFGIHLMGKPSFSFSTLLNMVKGPPKQHGYFSLQRATYSYDTFLPSAFEELAAMRKSYSKLGRAHKHVGYALGYPSKLDRLAEAIKANAALTSAIANLSREQFPTSHGQNAVDNGDVSRVKEALRHFVRDWSTEGQQERNLIFQPILDALRQVPMSRRKNMRVLVPGSGLGRLAWEISKLGFHTTAIELSYFMTLALRFLLSPSSTHQQNQHTIYPYSMWFSHQRNNDNTFRPVSFPDEIPRLGDTLFLKEGDFNQHLPSGAGYDFVVTLFFIDTSLNVIETVEHIHAILRPGGQWINLGPLLWPSGAQARLELSLEEILALIEATGFRLDTRSPVTQRRTVVCEYTADARAMMKWMYHAEFWVATKVEDGLVPEMD